MGQLFIAYGLPFALWRLWDFTIEQIGGRVR